MSKDTPETPKPTDAPAPLRLVYRSRRVLWMVFGFAFAAEIAMFLLDYHVNYARGIDLAPLRRIFNTETETGLASWFAATQTFLVALMLWALFVTTRARGASRLVWLGWLMLALLFTYMAIDDGAKVHERVGTSFRMLEERAAIEAGGTTDDTLTGLFPSYSWQVVYLPFFAAAGMGMLAFFWRQLRGWTGRLLVVGALGCLVVAVGLDFSEGLDDIHPLNIAAGIGDMPAVDLWALRRFDREGVDVVLHFSKSFEETLEMLGFTLFLVAFLRHWMQEASHLELRFVTRHD